MKTCAATLTLLIAIAPIAADAQAPTGAKLLEAVERCRLEKDRSVRLDCYDRASDSLIAARRSGAMTLLTAEEAAEQRRKAFGSAKPRQPEITTLDSTVMNIAVVGRDQYRITLVDGSIWRTTEIVRVAPRVGNTVHIRRGALNSYLGSFSGARSLRIERVR